MLHITIAHILHTFIQMCATSCACMWHECGAEPIFVYAAYIQYGCIVCAARVQRICTVCAATKQIYVQHTSNLSVRVSRDTHNSMVLCMRSISLHSNSSQRVILESCSRELFELF